MRKLFLLFLFLLSVGYVHAQSRTVTGTITDQTGESLPGVNVVVKGTTIGTITDLDGKFTISIPSDAEVLQFSYVGMKPQEAAIGNKTTFSVELEEETFGIEEVIAVGYGIQRRSEITGAISSVKGVQLAKMPVGDVGKSLTGIAVI